jgi:chemotaxis protein methyltransferase CheR
VNVPLEPVLTAAEFQKISTLAHEQFGLSLPEGKQSLVAARLAKKIREGGFQGFHDYYRHVMQDRSGEAMIGLIDALTTNHTSFFREPAHFDLLRAKAAQDFGDSPSLRVWSAACSSGEEPYSIAMTLLELLQSNPCRWANDVRIVASDISTRVLSKAQSATYEAARFEGMPDAARRAFLLKGTGSREGWFKLKPAVTQMVRFERINLIEPLPRRKFQFIFCRNAMIYFDKTVQAKIVSSLVECLEPGGYLFVGHSETLNGIDHPLTYLKPAAYINTKRRRA